MLIEKPFAGMPSRVIIQKTSNGEVISNDVLFDENFRTNEVVINFELTELDLEDEVQIRLETNQPKRLA